MMSEKYTSKPIPLTPAIRKCEFDRAMLQFHKVDHSGSSFQARIFFNNAEANESTPLDLAHGYAGRFHVFGHGKCYGDEGHCDPIVERRPFDTRSAHPLTPREAEVNVTAALLKAAAETDRVVVTVVPVLMATMDPKEAKDCFHFENLSLLVRSSHGLLSDPLASAKNPARSAPEVAVTPAPTAAPAPAPEPPKKSRSRSRRR